MVNFVHISGRSFKNFKGARPLAGSGLSVWAPSCSRARWTLDVRVRGMCFGPPFCRSQILTSRWQQPLGKQRETL